MITVGDVLLEALRFHDINQRTLAKRAGVSCSTITNIIGGRCGLGMEVAYKLATTIGYLTGPELLMVQLKYQIHQYEQENGLHKG